MSSPGPGPAAESRLGHGAKRRLVLRSSTRVAVTDGKPEWDAADAEAALLVSHRPVLPLLPLRRLPRLLWAPPPDAGRVFAGPKEGGGRRAGEARPR